MEIGPVTRVTAPPEPTLAPRADTAAPVPPPSVDRAGDEPRLDAPPASRVERRLTIDPQTRQVVSATFDRDTGELVRQVPDEALRRLHIYAHALRQTEVSAAANGRLAIEA